MKLQMQNTIGLTAGILIAVSVILIVQPPPPTTSVYNSFRVEGNALHSLYIGDFSRMSFVFVSSGTNKFDFVPTIFNSANVSIPLPAGLVRSLGTGTSISGTRTLDGSLYHLEKYRPPTGPMELYYLDSIVSRNPGGYLIFTAGDFAKIDPTHPNYIYYQITIYNINNLPIDYRPTNPGLTQLNPCPPAHQN